MFGGSAWEWDEATQQYYYHAFLKEQPDLNWRNPAVQRAMLEVMQFWLDKGVDGFRIDVIWHLGKDEHFRDNPPNPDYREGESDEKRFLRVYSEDQPIVHDFVADMRRLVDRYDHRLLIGEIYLPLDRLLAYYGKDNDGVHLPFNFPTDFDGLAGRSKSTPTSTATKGACRPETGPTGCWATTTSPAW